MSKKTDIRARNKAVTAYRMQQEGYTTNEIASLLDYKPEQVRSAVQRGERLNSLTEGK